MTNHSQEEKSETHICCWSAAIMGRQHRCSSCCKCGKQFRYAQENQPSPTEEKTYGVGLNTHAGFGSEKPPIPEEWEKELCLRWGNLDEIPELVKFIEETIAKVQKEEMEKRDYMREVHGGQLAKAQTDAKRDFAEKILEMIKYELSFDQKAYDNNHRDQFAKGAMTAGKNIQFKIEDMLRIEEALTN